MTGFRVSIVCLLLVSVSFTFGCGDGEPHLMPRPPSLASCADGWQVVSPPRTPYSPPRALIYREGEVIYSACTVTGCAIEALPVQGGTPRIIAGVLTAWDLWVEGDQVFFAFDTQLWQVPVSGGTPTQLVTDDARSNDIFAHALTPTSLIWVRWGYDSVAQQSTDEVWSTPRDGSGEPTLLANVGDAGIVEELVVVGDSVLVAGQGPTGTVVPLGEGVGRKLDQAGMWYAGADAQGVYGWIQTGPNSFSMRQAPIDGEAARSFWPGMPIYGLADRIWSDGSGGWFAVVIELFDDGQIHRSVFFIDSNQRGTRVACDPNPQALDGVKATPAFSADSAYIVNEVLQDPSNAAWEIVRIPRPLAQ